MVKIELTLQLSNSLKGHHEKTVLKQFSHRKRFFQKQKLTKNFKKPQILLY